MPSINNGETLNVKGTLNIQSGTLNLTDGQIPASKIASNTSAEIVVPIQAFRTWDDLTSALPGTAASDDLAIIEGTFGTDAPTIQSSDAGGTTVTQYARFQVTLPENYQAGEGVTVRLRAGMVTTVSDTTATIDVEAYLHDSDGSVGSDLCATAAADINSLTKANKDFTITPTGFVAGDVLDIRLTVAITDSGDAGVMLGEISKVSVITSVK